MITRKNLITLFTLILISSRAAAFEPVFSVEAYGRDELYSEGPDVYSLAGAGFSAAQRSTFGCGYWSWYASAGFERYYSGIHGFYDTEQAGADMHLENDNFSFESGATITLSSNDIEYGRYLRPDWSMALYYRPADSPFSGSIDYTGSYIYQELDLEDRTIHGINLSTGYDRSLQLGVSLNAGLTVENYSEYFLLDSANQDTATVRSDLGFHGSFEFEGLRGYFTEWRASLYFAGLDSNANRWIGGSSELEGNSEDRWTAGGEYRIDWSPSISTHFQVGGYLEYRTYTGRTVLTSAEISAGTPLSIIRTGTLVEADWTSNGILFWILSASFFRSFSEDQEFDTWNTGIQMGLEYTF